MQQRDFLVLDDDRVAVDEAFGLARRAAGIQDVEGMGVWNSSELEGLVWYGFGEEGVQRWKGTIFLHT